MMTTSVHVHVPKIGSNHIPPKKVNFEQDAIHIMRF